MSIYLSEIAMFLWAAPADKSTMDTILKIAPLVPALLAAAFKLTEDHGREKRKQTLVDTIAKLAKNIADLPVLPDSDATARLRDAFHVELEHAYSELKTLQTKTPRRTVGFSSITAGLRSAFLLYRPRGFGAWLLHLGFYACILIFAFMTLGLMAAPADPANKDITPGVVIVIYTIMGIPPLLFWYFAMKVHRKQCAAQEAAHTAQMTASVA